MRRARWALAASVGAVLAPALALASPAQTSPVPQAPSAAAPSAEGSAPRTAEPGPRTQMLRLRDGRILWGAVDGHDPEGIAFRRLEDGGVVPLPWSFLDPAEERELRLRLGYVDAVAEAIMLDADRLVLADGSEIVGRIVNRTDEHLWVKRAIGTLPVAKGLIASVSRLRVPALELFTKDELYQEKAAELQGRLVLEGAAGAQAHLELARYAERLLDYPHALEHYRLVEALDPSFERDTVQAALARAEEKAALQDQVDLLAEADLWRARKRYDRAFERLAEFTERYPRSPLLDDWNTMRRRVERYQERDLREEVVRRWHYHAASLARRAAREAESYEAALRYIDESMADDLVAAVTADLDRLAPGISGERVRALWDEREGGRYHQASYGLGTWLLGEERALAAVGEPEEEPEAEAGTQADARAKLEDRIQRYLKNQELARKARRESADAEDPEAFWTRWSSAARSQWILAYFVESSGQFDLVRARLSNCRECGGTGTRDVVYSGGAISGATASNAIVACPTCHTIGRVRRIRYR